MRILPATPPFPDRPNYARSLLHRPVGTAGRYSCRLAGILSGWVQGAPFVAPRPNVYVRARDAGLPETGVRLDYR